MEQAMSVYFYKGQRLATKVSADKASSVFAGADFLLGEVCEGTHLLLAADRQNSIIKVRNSRCYSPYGFDQVASRETLLGYKGEHRDVASGYDLLGNGVRAYSSVLMRFCSPDVISPFDAGGINAYAYCEGEPINYLDTDGRMRVPVIPSPWAYKQPYGISQRSRAIQGVSQPSPPPVTQEMVAAQSVNGNRLPSPGVHQNGALWQMPKENRVRQAVPTVFWEQRNVEVIDPAGYAKSLVERARNNGVLNKSQIPDALLISAISHKITTGGNSLKSWGRRSELGAVGYKDSATAQINLRIQINRIVRSNFPELATPNSKASLAGLKRWSGKFGLL
ncbi:TPA: RHS repeat-associated core domain-containing protein [Pseudomonas putida]|nr:RHS repeat-associated core domain-containing protein [Pseudomonas putida]HDS1680554.1 RHS repeat-associated core domain-containing protein [Pseudomonas putida]